MGTFTARYKGFCNNCDERFEAGDEVEFDVNDEIVHVECPGSSERPVVVCAECFIVKPCGCDD